MCYFCGESRWRYRARGTYIPHDVETTADLTYPAANYAAMYGTYQNPGTAPYLFDQALYGGVKGGTPHPLTSDAPPSYDEATSPPPYASTSLQ